MIVSHQHRVIFVKPRKVAGTSFEIALSKYMAGGDIITPISRKDEAIRRKQGFLGARNFHFAMVERLVRNPARPWKLFGYELPMRFYNHIPASVARKRLGADVWDSYRKISIVRNPWDRAISLFYWRNARKDAVADLSTFTRFFKDNAAMLETNYANYFIDGRDTIDIYVRYEHFEEDMLTLEGQLPAFSGLWETFKGINAKGDTRDRSLTRQKIFADNPEVDAMVRRVNAWEIEKFGYSL